MIRVRRHRRVESPLTAGARDPLSRCTVRTTILGVPPCVSTLPAAAAQTAETPADRPNIVFILTDDEDSDLHAFMPKTKALLHDEGTTFDNYFVTYSLCCPSRATTLRGQYPHSTGVRGNTPPLGGFETFRALGRETSTIATWLRAAGNYTAMFGKYLNGYQPAAGLPAGWSEWYVGSSA